MKPAATHALATSRPSAPGHPIGLRHLDHLNLSVADLSETVDWYQRVFGFQVVEEDVCEDGTRLAILRAGEAMLCCYEHADWEAVSNAERRRRGIHGINHFALRITDRAAWEATVRREGLRLSYGGAATDYPHSTSWYVEDPSGYGIEVALWKDDRVRF